MSIIRFRGSDYVTRTGETVLDALLRQGASVNFSCRAGSCGRCALRVLDGAVPDACVRGLSAELRDRGYFLPCRCVSHQDISIADINPAHFIVDATVIDKQFPVQDICVLKLEPHNTLLPSPGQHVLLQHPDGTARPYSVASLPDEDYYVELHVALRRHGHVSRWVHHDLAIGDTVRVQRPEGRFGYAGTARDQPLVMLCTGTGAAPIIAVLRDALRQNHRAPIHVFHGAREPEGLYLDAQMRELSRTHANLFYVACCSKRPASDAWQAGRIILVAASLLPQLNGYRVFVAGNPAMVADAIRWALELGVEPTDIISDPFVDNGQFAPATAPTRVLPPPNDALWTALGEGRILHQVLVDFYALAFADERLGPYFSGVTQQRLVEKQYSFLRSLICGCRDYFGQRPRNAHHWMVISNDLFDYRLELMAACLRRHGVTEPWLSAWATYENAFRADIVKREPWPRMVDGKPVLHEGLEEARLDSGTLCDVCGAEIAAGMRVRFHSRLGTTYCPTCSATGHVASRPERPSVRHG